MRISDWSSDVCASDLLALRDRPDLGRGDLPVLEQHQRRNAAHPVFLRRAGIVVDVQLRDGDLVLHIGGDFFQRGRDHLARPAPFGPEIDENRPFGLQYAALEDRKSTRLNSSTNAHLVSRLLLEKKKNTTS